MLAHHVRRPEGDGLRGGQGAHLLPQSLGAVVAPNTDKDTHPRSGWVPPRSRPGGTGGVNAAAVCGQGHHRRRTPWQELCCELPNVVSSKSMWMGYERRSFPIAGTTSRSTARYRTACVACTPASTGTSVASTPRTSEWAPTPRMPIWPTVLAKITMPPACRIQSLQSR